MIREAGQAADLRHGKRWIQQQFLGLIRANPINIGRKVLLGALFKIRRQIGVVQMQRVCHFR